ncbi:MULTISPECIES: DUF1108 family protein [Mammaliicoccus]|uniref:DUF1108 family protein n=1 Tax=Mammaliicoccus TaxID=2803850 RepID=UPI001EFB00D0|nr:MULTISPECIES: DUF1108 family protein [Mammaliicoccus]UXU84608.1 DUF1108 family protein [Mammaliicoccus sciuri]UXU94456.1 DUF1108 family protein [Mammaliicoccus sciuri]UXV16404.1 DUF1108 family protein [Mammaliicoccus sciuri]UXV24666.1 DUF1108 family protein [Mammaliicoccus sciuri]UXV27450.1 DUF1108 family protein [Mammaliicoccus sciuri]
MSYFKTGSQIIRTEYHYGFKFLHRYEVINEEIILVRVFSLNHEEVYATEIYIEDSVEAAFEELNDSILSWIDDNTSEVDALMVEILKGSNKPYDFKIKARY